MSWFQTSNFTSLAKNALKEAQKTLDKALDIKVEDGEEGEEGSDTEHSEQRTLTEESTIQENFSNDYFDDDEDDNYDYEGGEARIETFGSSSGLIQEVIPEFYCQDQEEDNSNVNEVIIGSGLEEDNNFEVKNENLQIITCNSDEEAYNIKNPYDEDSQSKLFKETNVNNKLSKEESYQNSKESSKNQSENEENSPKISSRATSSISVLSECNNEKDYCSPQPSSPNNHTSHSSSNSPSFEVIESSYNQKHKFQKDNPSQLIEDKKDFLVESGNSIISTETTRDIEDVPDDLDRNLSFVKTETIKTRQKAATSSNSSSDIEIIPLDFQIGKSDVETQTDLQYQKDKKSKEFKKKEEENLQLREEGEKLSKRQLELNNIIKKLRSKEKETDNTIKRLKDDLSYKSSENDKLIKTFLAKENIEKSQLSTISKLNEEKRKFECKVDQLSSELEDETEKCSQMKASVEESLIEILELRLEIVNSQKERCEYDFISKEKSELQNRVENLVKDIESLRNKYDHSHEKFEQDKSEMKSQISILTSKLHDYESSFSDHSSEIADATMPLSLEIEKLQRELKNKTLECEKIENKFQTEILNSELKVKSSVEREKSTKEMNQLLENSVENLELKFNQITLNNGKLNEKIIQESILNDQNNIKIKILEERINELELENGKKCTEMENLEIQVKSERHNSEVERKKVEHLQQQQLQQQQQQQQQKSLQNSTRTTNSSIITISNENSPPNSIISESSYLDEVFDPNNQNIRSMTPKSFFDAFSSANFMENLQSQLRMREGELLSIQGELMKTEKIRKTLNEEIAHLTVQNQELLQQVEKMNDLYERLEEVEKNYNAVLQLYGEKAEEADELRLDLQDVKEMYKIQIEQLLKKGAE